MQSHVLSAKGVEGRGDYPSPEGPEKCYWSVIFGRLIRNFDETTLKNLVLRHMLFKKNWHW